MGQRLEQFAADQLPKVEVQCICENRLPGGGDHAVRGEETNIDLIAMPTHGYGPFRRALLGSVTAKVLT